MPLVYLDNNATTRPAPEVIDAMRPYLEEWYGNPSSVHRFGQRARQGIDGARGQVAQLINAAESELLFTGGGTEAVNTAIRGLLAVRAPRKTIVTTTVEHSATRELCAALAKEGLATVVELPVDTAGQFDLDQLAAALTDDVALVTLMWANNETGVLFPVADVARLCRARRIPFHCDGTQAVGKIPVDVAALGVDAMSLASHKFHGPKGAGALFTRRGLRLRPTLVGGPQERGRRGGTENVPGIVGMGRAAELAREWLSSDSAATQRVADAPEHPSAPPILTPRQLLTLRDHLEHEILTRIPNSAVNGAAPRLPNTTNVGFSRLEAEAILLLLSEQDVCASAGAACASGSLEPSHVLRAMNIDPKLAHGAIRFSLSRYSTAADVARALEVLPPIIDRLRAVLPVG
ncbi:MAG TPA: aminotransferase class V-fold PLP-dependent enzyme [Tepidisphaeraceae bacterium]|nr:aminotransferase class V-fold PLP-dependent enzyme [Tepidisphaeraceae bacterium]